MTIRTDSELDTQILDAIEADRAELDRFASTPNRHLLGALIAPSTTAADFWSLASTKLLALAASFAVVGAVAIYVTRPVAAPSTLPSHSTSMEATPTAPQPQPNDVRNSESPRSASKVITPNTLKPAATPVEATKQDQPNVSPKPQEAIDLDHWNSGAPQLVQLPTKIEVQTKAK